MVPERSMPVRKLLLSVVLAIGGLPAGAVPVRVALEWPAGMPASPLPRVHIQAVRIVGATGDGSALQAEADAGPDGAAVLDLGDGGWQVQATAPGYWSQEADVAVTGQGPISVRFALWPAASLYGQITPAQGETLPDALEVRLSATLAAAGEATAQPPVSQPETSPTSAKLRCRIDKGSWSCLGPPGLFDVRLEASGFAPHYLWGVSLKAGVSTDLGEIQLRRTASVFGRAVRKDGSSPPGPCRATLQPDVERRGPEPDPDSAPAGEPSVSVSLSPRGYFQIVAVQPGRHLLVVECPEASALRELIVQPDGETRIDPALPLEEQTIEIAVTPKLDPVGRPWQLTVDATNSPARRIADKVALSADGRWERRGLMAGDYRVAVSSSDGTAWLQRNVDLGKNSGQLSLRLASVKVRGQVMLASQPVRARLLFSNEAGGEPVTLKTDQDGRFQGLLPIAPDVKETSWIVEAHVAQPPSTRLISGVNVQSVPTESSAWLDLILPLIAVRGTVISENGRPQRGTQVTLENSGGIRTTTSTDDGGSFEVPELPPGQYTAVAETDEAASDRTPFEVVDGGERELQLILHPFRRVSFYVVSSGYPVADAAVQVWIAPGVPRAFAHTDRNGRFQVNLPSEITEVGMTVGEPGYALKMVRLPVPSENNSSPDANKISLDDSGGTLQLSFQPSDGTLPDSAALYLVHNGAVQDARTVAGWGSNQTAGSEDEAVVDVIEPGDYALCVLTDPSQVAAIWGGATPPDRCQKGTVQQGQTLTLQPQ